MRKKSYAIPSLLAAGFLAPSEVAAALPASTHRGVDDSSMLNAMLARDQPMVVSSHASHASHVSHASGSGGGYIAPLYTPPPPVVTSSSLVVQVQVDLQALGYYQGPITGVVDSATRLALIRFQADWILKGTGTVTPEVVQALKIGQ